MDGKAPDLVSRLQAIRDAHHLDFAMYWAITSIISPLIGADVEYPIQQMEYWLGQRSGQVAGAEATDPGPGWGAAR